MCDQEHHPGLLLQTSVLPVQLMAVQDSVHLWQHLAFPSSARGNQFWLWLCWVRALAGAVLLQWQVSVVTGIVVYFEVLAL